MNNNSRGGEPVPSSPDSQDVVNAGLRRWARGGYSDEAAVELLIRTFDGRFAHPSWPWIKPNSRPGEYWLDGDTVNDHTRALSGGEQRVLAVVASLASYQPLDRSLADVMSVDRTNQELILAALSHAGGSHQHSDYLPGSDGQRRLVELGSLHPWPDADHSPVTRGEHDRGQPVGAPNDLRRGVAAERQDVRTISAVAPDARRPR